MSQQPVEDLDVHSDFLRAVVGSELRRGRRIHAATGERSLYVTFGTGLLLLRFPH